MKSKLKNDVERILNSPEIIEKANNSQVGFITYLMEYLKYFLLMETEEGVEEYINSKNKGEYVVQKIAEKLEADPNTDEGKEIISEYVFRKRLGNEAYVFHSTNSVNAEEIKKYGMHPQKRLWDADEMQIVYEIFQNAPNPVESDLGLVIGDGEKWFFDTNIKNMMRYAISPEWMNLFFGKEIFSKKDTEAAMDRINNAIRNSGLDDMEHSYEAFIVRSFFTENWKRYEDATPRLLIIPRNYAIGADLNFEHFKIKAFDRGFSLDDIYERMKYYIEYESINCSSVSIVPPSEIEFVRLTGLFPNLEPSKDAEIGEPINLGGTGEMYLAYDVYKNQYLFKPGYKRGTKDYDGFKITASIVAYEIQNIIDQESAVKCESIKLDDTFGTIQPKFEIDSIKTKALINFQDGIGELDEETLKGLMREYIADYLLCNYDSHPRNFIIGEDGILRGVDKEQSFKYIREEGSDNPQFSINFNSRYGERPSIYSTIFQKIQEGKISPDILEYMNEYVDRIDNYSNEEFERIIENYCIGLVTVSPDDLNADFTKFDEVMNLIMSRKVKLKETMDKMKSELREKYEEAVSRRDNSETYGLTDLIGYVRGVDPLKRNLAKTLISGLERKELGEEENSTHDKI